MRSDAMRGIDMTATVEALNGARRSGHSTRDIQLVVVEKYYAAEEVVVVEFADPGGDTLPAWEPGAHVELQLTAALRRRYSLTGGDSRTWRIGVLRDPRSRGGSTFVHDRLQVGMHISAIGPLNDFGLIPAPHYVFVAGGIGITPIVPMVHEADRRGAGWRLLYGGRRRGSMAFIDELRRSGYKVSIHPQDECGLLPIRHALNDIGADTLVYCCGPGPLLDAVRRLSAGWPPGTLHVERFNSDQCGNEFVVHLARSKRTLRIPEDTSILQAVEDANVPIMSSCRAGHCGTCETTVLDGTPDHRDDVLTDQERTHNDTMMICVSRSLSTELTLDL